MWIRVQRSVPAAASRSVDPPETADDWRVEDRCRSRARRCALVDLVQLPHLLIGGTTGEGKTAFLRQLIASLVLALSAERLRLALIDLKGMEFGIFQQLPHMWSPVARELDSALVLIQELGAELDRR